MNGVANIAANAGGDLGQAPFSSFLYNHNKTAIFARGFGAPAADIVNVDSDHENLAPAGFIKGVLGAGAITGRHHCGLKVGVMLDVQECDGVNQVLLIRRPLGQVLAVLFGRAEQVVGLFVFLFAQECVIALDSALGRGDIRGLLRSCGEG